MTLVLVGVGVTHVLETGVAVSLLRVRPQLLGDKHPNMIYVRSKYCFPYKLFTPGETGKGGGVSLIIYWLTFSLVSQPPDNGRDI